MNRCPLMPIRCSIKFELGEYPRWEVRNVMFRVKQNNVRGWRSGLGPPNVHLLPWRIPTHIVGANGSPEGRKLIKRHGAQSTAYPPVCRALLISRWNELWERRQFYSMSLQSNKASWKYVLVNHTWQLLRLAQIDGIGWIFTFAPCHWWVN